MAPVLVHRARKAYGAAMALDDVSFEIASGEFVTLLGPSGCGKSTTLRAVAGLADIDAGRIVIGGRDVTRVPIHRRDIGMVFQNLALFPHMTVADNVAFGLKMRRVGPGERARRVADALALVQLADFGRRFPHQLSGGQQQRVALARALVIDPSVLLLDEPFSALDRKLREEMQAELREITRRLGITSLFVTHDQEEALTLSDRIAVMNAGRIDQIGSPDDIYMRPATRFVADFMGVANILPATVVMRNGQGARLRSDGLDMECIAPVPAQEGQPVTVAIRPDLIRLVPAGDLPAGPNRATGRVLTCIDHGGFSTVSVDVGHGTRLVVRRSKVDALAAAPVEPGSTVALAWDAERVVLLRDGVPAKEDAKEINV